MKSNHLLELPAPESSPTGEYDPALEKMLLDAEQQHQKVAKRTEKFQVIEGGLSPEQAEEQRKKEEIDALKNQIDLNLLDKESGQFEDKVIADYKLTTGAEPFSYHIQALVEDTYQYIPIDRSQYKSLDDSLKNEGNSKPLQELWEQSQGTVVKASGFVPIEQPTESFDSSVYAASYERVDTKRKELRKQTITQVVEWFAGKDVEAFRSIALDRRIDALPAVAQLLNDQLSQAESLDVMARICATADFSEMDDELFSSISRFFADPTESGNEHHGRFERIYTFIGELIQNKTLPVDYISPLIEARESIHEQIPKQDDRFALSHEKIILNHTEATRLAHFADETGYIKLAPEQKLKLSPEQQRQIGEVLSSLAPDTAAELEQILHTAPQAPITQAFLADCGLDGKNLRDVRTYLADLWPHEQVLSSHQIDTLTSLDHEARSTILNTPHSPYAQAFFREHDIDPQLDPGYLRSVIEDHSAPALSPDDVAHIFTEEASEVKEAFFEKYKLEPEERSAFLQELIQSSVADQYNEDKARAIYASVTNQEQILIIADRFPKLGAELATKNGLLKDPNFIERAIFPKISEGRDPHRELLAVIPQEIIDTQILPRAKQLYQREIQQIKKEEEITQEQYTQAARHAHAKNILRSLIDRSPDQYYTQAIDIALHATKIPEKTISTELEFFTLSAINRIGEQIKEALAERPPQNARHYIISIIDEFAHGLQKIPSEFRSSLDFTYNKQEKTSSIGNNLVKIIEKSADDIAPASKNILQTYIQRRIVSALSPIGESDEINEELAQLATTLELSLHEAYEQSQPTSSQLRPATPEAQKSIKESSNTTELPIHHITTVEHEATPPFLGVKQKETPRIVTEQRPVHAQRQEERFSEVIPLEHLYANPAQKETTSRTVTEERPTHDQQALAQLPEIFSPEQLPIHSEQREPSLQEELSTLALERYFDTKGTRIYSDNPEHMYQFLAAQVHEDLEAIKARNELEKKKLTNKRKGFFSRVIEFADESINHATREAIRQKGSRAARNLRVLRQVLSEKFSEQDIHDQITRLNKAFMERAHTPQK
jgi:hypothetical protein